MHVHTSALARPWEGSITGTSTSLKPASHTTSYRRHVDDSKQLGCHTAGCQVQPVLIYDIVMMARLLWFASRANRHYPFDHCPP